MVFSKNNIKFNNFNNIFIIFFFKLNIRLIRKVLLRKKKKNINIEYKLRKIDIYFFFCAIYNLISFSKARMVLEVVV